MELNNNSKIGETTNKTKQNIIARTIDDFSEEFSLIVKLNGWINNVN